MRGNTSISNTPWFRNRKSESRVIDQISWLMCPYSGGCLSTTTSEKVALRPFMSEFCLVLCGFLMNLIKSKEKPTIRQGIIIQMVNWKDFSCLPPTFTPGGRNGKQNGSFNCRKKGGCCGKGVAIPNGSCKWNERLGQRSRLVAADVSLKGVLD